MFLADFVDSIYLVLFLFLLETPSIRTPAVSDQCMQSGQSSIALAWDEVTATNADGENITCTDSIEGMVSLTGGTLTAGSHTVTCTVTKNDCQGTGNFSFIVKGKVPNSATKLSYPIF